jgi:hypothetical protein
VAGQGQRDPVTYKEFPSSHATEGETPGEPVLQLPASELG